MNSNVNCTWLDCSREATQPQLDKNGEQWANLCQECHDYLEHGFVSLDPKRILSNWVKAQGGAKKAAEVMKPEIEAGVKLLIALKSGHLYGKFTKK